MIVAIIVSLLAGATIVLSRTLNAKLAIETSLLASTFYNYLVGFLVAISTLLLFGKEELMHPGIRISTNIFIYFGGIFGIIVVLILNMTVSKISSFYVTLLLFIGQIFTGILLDVLLSKTYSIKQMIGGLFVILGLSINLYIDRKDSKMQSETLCSQP